MLNVLNLFADDQKIFFNIANWENKICNIAANMVLPQQVQFQANEISCQKLKSPTIEEVLLLTPLPCRLSSSQWQTDQNKSHISLVIDLCKQWIKAILKL